MQQDDHFSDNLPSFSKKLPFITLRDIFHYIHPNYSPAHSLEVETKLSNKSFYILRKVTAQELNPDEPLLQH